MTTMKEFLTQNTILPVTGTFTYKEHFTALEQNIVASLGGTIVITPKVETVSVAQKTTKISIKVQPKEVLIGTTSQDVVIDDTKTVHITIDPSS